jgi:hypothetical protein
MKKGRKAGRMRQKESMKKDRYEKKNPESNLETQ